MTIEQARDDILNSGIRLGAGDFIDVESLKIAVDVMDKYLDYTKGYRVVTEYRVYERVTPNEIYCITNCGKCGKRLCTDKYDKIGWNEYMKYHYRATIPNYCPECGTKTTISEKKEAERVAPVGRWIDNADSYLCSVCGFETDNPNRNPAGSGFCPICKARMIR